MSEPGAPLILLVEDNPDDETLMRLALEKSGVANTIETARDGAEALDRLLGPGSDGQPLPAIVLLDIKLPKVDGIQVLGRLREDPRTTSLPVVIVTTSKSEDDVQACYDLGANGFVAKAIDFTAFCDAMRVLALYWLTVNVPPPPREEGAPL